MSNRQAATTNGARHKQKTCGSRCYGKRKPGRHAHGHQPANNHENGHCSTREAGNRRYMQIKTAAIIMYIVITMNAGKKGSTRYMHSIINKEYELFAAAKKASRNHVQDQKAYITHGKLKPHEGWSLMVRRFR
ncbi:hypothetical protein AVEN_261896-1 [Araneus ventricosus]|uniref:Uncharacterized protein n=1 Tax=Araneus ventricosus TaxID=182803 RepID=A0A4Y2KRI0_ARAVE|nr:hypothetical protein AVEN_261896-1 [Araneus ventricosus]